MATRASLCSALLKRFRSKDDFLLRLVTVDETWIHHYGPENKVQSRQWVGPRSPRPKKFKTQPSASKVMDTVFWDAARHPNVKKEKKIAKQSYESYHHLLP